MTTPNYAGLWPLLEFLTNYLGKVSYKDQHITKYRPSLLLELLTSAGFSNSKVETHLFSAPFFAAFGWSFADVIARLEPVLITRYCGHLLLGTAINP